MFCFYKCMWKIYMLMLHVGFTTSAEQIMSCFDTRYTIMTSVFSVLIIIIYNMRLKYMYTKMWLLIISKVNLERTAGQRLLTLSMHCRCCLYLCLPVALSLPSFAFAFAPPSLSRGRIG